MKADKKTMVHVRIVPDLLKRLKHIAIEKEMSLQQLVEHIVSEGVLKYE